MCPQAVFDRRDPVRCHSFRGEEGRGFVGCPVVVVVDFSGAFEWSPDIVKPRCCSEDIPVDAVRMLVRELERDVTHAFRVEDIVCGEGVLLLRAGRREASAYLREE